MIRTEKGKLLPTYIGPFEILACVGKVAYELVFLPRLSGVYNAFYISMLKEYHQGPTLYVIEFNDIEVNDNISYQERLMQILDRETKNLLNKEIPLVKVQWNHHDKRKASWEMESVMHKKYSELFRD